MNEKNIKNIFLGIFLLTVAIAGTSIRARAEDEASKTEAIFHVQTAEGKEDGIIRVAVYLTEVDDLGGVEAEFIYDASKVTYIGSGLGASFAGGIGETNHLPDTQTVRGLVIFPEAKATHGELMYAFFKLNAIESYQPQLKVVDLVDSSDEIKPIPYSITYQQADGSWTETQDTSGKKASEEVIAEARETFGAEEDQNPSGEVITGEKSAEERQGEAGGDSENKKGISVNEKGESTGHQIKDSLSGEKGKKKSDETEKIFGVVMLIVVLCMMGALAWYLRKRRQKKDSFGKN